MPDSHGWIPAMLEHFGWDVVWDYIVVMGMVLVQLLTLLLLWLGAGIEKIRARGSG